MKHSAPYKVILLSVVFSFVVILSGGCKKDTITTQTAATIYTIPGLWTGSHTNISAPSTALTISIKPDGTATYENVLSGTQQFSSGTWTLTGKVFTYNTTCIYGFTGNVGVKQKFTASFDSTTGVLSSGQWANTYPLSAPGSGTFIVTKVQ